MSGWAIASSASMCCRSARARSPGSTLPLDREFVRKLLGFARVSENSMDAVSDRDFIIEYNAACALLAVHLSRLSEDLILWSIGGVQIHPHR